MIQTTTNVTVWTTAGKIVTDMSIEQVSAIYTMAGAAVTVIVLSDGCKIPGKVKTIKHVRALFGCGLREAKAFVDAAHADHIDGGK